MNILGQPFAPWVKQQINVRQNSLGTSPNLPNQDLLYQNAKSPWLRLASTVDITLNGENHKKLIANTSIGWDALTGDIPAKQFILQGGASRIVKNTTSEGDITRNFRGLNSGLNGENPDRNIKTGDRYFPRFSGAYGWGGLEDKGFAPMPGVVGAKVEYYKSGALSKATVKMKCFTRNQLALMDVLYMRPGYNLLLEFGWSQFLDNDGNLQTYDNFFSPALSYILDPYSPPITTEFNAKSNISPGFYSFLPDEEVKTADLNVQPSHFDVLNLINKERANRFGNYEGVFGKISNFDWSFNKDGSYDCSVDLIGMGDIMESLKINTKLDEPKYPPDTLPDGSSRWDFKNIQPRQNEVDRLMEEGRKKNSGGIENTVIANKTKTTLNKLLFEVYETATSSQGVGGATPSAVHQLGYDFALADRSDFTYDPPRGYIADLFEPLRIPDFPLVRTVVDPTTKTTETAYSNIPGLTIDNAILALYQTQLDNEWNDSPQVYLTFGGLLALLQKNSLLYSKNGCPLFSFDVNFTNLKKDENYMLHNSTMFSADPLICLVPTWTTAWSQNNGVPAKVTTVHQTLYKVLNTFRVADQSDKARLCGIYLNINHIVDILDKTERDEDGGLSLLTFLKTIIASFTKALGGINSIDVRIDEVTQQVRFYENCPQINPLENESEFATLNVSGITPTNTIANTIGGGSFVRNVSMKGSISSDMASMITIGAQSNGNQPSSNSTGLSTYNSGLIDRVIPERNNAYSPVSGSAEEGLPLTLKASYNAIFGKHNDYKIHYKDLGANGTDVKVKNGSLFFSIYSFRRRWLREDIDALVELNTTFQNLVCGRLVKDAKLQSPTFLPFNLAFDVDGMSGIKLYEKFYADDRVLPPSYGRNNVDLLVKTLNHTVSTVDWLTQIDTISTPRQTLSENKYETPPPLKKKKNQDSNNSLDLKTLTSGYPIGKIFYDGPTAKKQIVVHHTAGRQVIANTIRSWSKRTDHVATHYITNNAGEKEQLFADEAWANHLGVKSSSFTRLGIPYQNLNKTSLAIEMQAWGYLSKGGYTKKYDDGRKVWITKDPNKYFSYAGEEVPIERVAQPVDKYGNPSPYKSNSYYEKYSDANIQRVKEIMTGWMSKYNIPFIYNYDELFPNKKTIIPNAFRGTPGVYTHNTFRTGKSDVFPQAELIAMFKSIATKIV